MGAVGVGIGSGVICLSPRGREEQCYELVRHVSGSVSEQEWLLIRKAHGE